MSGTPGYPGRYLFDVRVRDADLSGFTVQDSEGVVRVDTVPRGFVLPANGVFVWARNAARFQELYGFAPDLSNLALTLNNGGDSVSLRDRQGNEVDFVAFELAPFSNLRAGNGESIQRLALEDTDSEADWAPSGATGPAPGDPGTFAAAPSASRAPLADAGPDRVGRAGDTVTLDASASSDPEGSPLSFFWSDGQRGPDPQVSLAPGVRPLTVRVGDGVVYGRDPVDTDRVSLLDSATSTVDFAVWALDRQSVVDAMVAARTRGVTVRVATDTDSLNDPDRAPFYARLTNAGIPVFQDNRAGLMHHKFCVVDNRFVWTGSYNPTDLGTLSNSNDAFLLESPSVAASYASEFEEFANGRFQEAKTNMPVTHHTVSGRLVETYFSPGGGVRQRILEAINSADTSIGFAIFTFTRPEIRDALIARAAAGVEVKGIADAGQAQNPFSVIADLEADPNVQVRRDSFQGFLHHKFLVIQLDGGRRGLQ